MLGTVVEPDVSWVRAMGAALTEALVSRGESRKWLAEAIDVDPATVSRILNGERPPSFEQLCRMATALGVTRRSLLARAGYIDGDGLIDPERLPPAGRRAVLAIIAAFASVDDNGPDDAEDVG